MWTFFQAKTVRQTVVRTAAEELEAQYKDAGNMPPAVKAQIEQWRKTAQRYDSEPETNEGRKELMARAKTHEAKREKARAAYHLFEYGSAAFQLAIVLAGAVGADGRWPGSPSSPAASVSSARPSRSWASSRRPWSTSRPTKTPDGVPSGVLRRSLAACAQPRRPPLPA